MKNWLLTILALTIAACGGDETGSEQTASQAPIDGQAGGGSAGGGYTGSGSGVDDFCFTAISVFWCDDSGGSGSSGGSTASAVHSQINDTEPNDDLANAVPVHWPASTSAEQRIGFGVEGTASSADDVADFFAFTPVRSADFYIGLCETGQVCGPWAADYRLPVATASVRILDQFGTEILSETLYSGSANAFEAHFESGVLYFALVVAEGMYGTTQSYHLSVGESLQQAADASVPEAPQLSAYVVDSYTNVQFDWIPPTQNEDGTALTDLAGFNLYLYDYVREGDSAGRRLIETINDPYATTRTINLEGYLDWYVSITAFNETGVESSHSIGVELIDAPQ